jgi:streptomycin 6-kinase
MIAARINGYVKRWQLTPDGPGFETASSFLVPVLHRGRPAMLKMLKPASDERHAAALLDYFDGDGAVCVYEAEADAMVLERAVGTQSLMQLATSGDDEAAAGILADTVRRLHAPRSRAAPAGLTPLRTWFGSLFRHESKHPQLARCAAVARRLLDSEREVIPLHGDLHHDNVLDAGPRGWLAVDPKALMAERAYDVANLLGNPYPHGDIVHSEDRMRRLAARYAAELDLDLARVTGFAFAHAGLAASYTFDDGGDPAYRLRCAAVLEPLVEV